MLTEFVIANTAASAVPLMLVFRGEPRLTGAGVISAVLVSLVLFKPLRACPGPRSRAVVLFFATPLFLVPLGALLAWNVQVGDSPAGSWLARLDGGFRLAIFGSAPALLTAFPLLLFANSLLHWSTRHAPTTSR